MRFMLMDNPAKQLGYSSIEEMCRWGEAEESILVICQEKFKIVFDMFFLKKGALHRRSLIIFLKNERYSDSVFNSASSFSPVYSWFLTSKPKTSRTNLRDVSASALLC